MSGDRIETLGFTSDQAKDAVGALADLVIAYKECDYAADSPERDGRLARAERAYAHLQCVDKLHRWSADLARERANASGASA